MLWLVVWDTLQFYTLQCVHPVTAKWRSLWMSGSFQHGVNNNDIITVRFLRDKHHHEVEFCIHHLRIYSEMCNIYASRKH